MSGRRLAREFAVASRCGRRASASRGLALLASWHSSGHWLACRSRAAPRGLWTHTCQRKEELRR